MATQFHQIANLLEKVCASMFSHVIFVFAEVKNRMGFLLQMALKNAQSTLHGGEQCRRLAIVVVVVVVVAFFERSAYFQTCITN